ncbi:class I nuclease-like protein [Trypanosoma rangeli]|uniref:Class I nuclease-like protein n=1 Tax=Trypanosoma rangeli TaxID=5698 RepID=A0A422N7B0_TRYRA|nr:class I nuclease-like protein [Trypanosoma rangeli]RNF01353.1 class I nuclease-like protein [Trypanosoma rangeli]|eukprot:RNF01353.1 class I nuclease-like protein [Trypanosoma rangeli]
MLGSSPTSALLLAVAVGFLVLSEPTHAWWCKGHMVVNEIAKRHLDRNVAELVDEAAANLSFSGPFPESFDFVQSACWADDIKLSGLKVMEDWHFIDTPYNPLNVPIKKDPLGKDNAKTVIESLTRTLEKKRKQEPVPYVLSFALVNLAHLYGDIHQPLHSITQFSPAYPDGDRGGNLEVVHVRGARMKLHAVWDSICQGEQPDPPRPLSKEEYAKLRAFADYLEDTYKPTTAEKSETNVSVMAEESYMIGVEVAYPGVVNGMELTEEYLERCKAAAEPRLVLAGRRLATILNHVFSDVDTDQSLKSRPHCRASCSFLQAIVHGAVPGRNE